jgi:hypothetical protein
VLDVGKLHSATSVMKENGIYRTISDVQMSAYHWYKAGYLKRNRHLSRKNLSTIRYFMVITECGQNQQTNAQGKNKRKFLDGVVLLRVDIILIIKP